MRTPDGLTAFLTLLALTAANPGSAADTWQTPDGKVAVTPPPASRFAADPSPAAPLRALWTSRDGQTVIAFLSDDAPADVRLSAPGLEEGTRDVVHGTLLASETMRISGVPAYKIAASGTLNGQKATICQVVFSFDGQLYKLMATCAASANGGDVTTNPDVQALIASVRILAPPAPAPTGSAAMPLAGGDAHDMNRLIARYGWTILIAALVSGLVLKKRKRTS